ncbi:unnamed protein product, partial [Rotaria socialis]
TENCLKYRYKFTNQNGSWWILWILVDSMDPGGFYGSWWNLRLLVDSRIHQEPPGAAFPPLDKDVASLFIDPSIDQFNILMVFNFSKPCSTAIILYELSHDVPSISYYEDEKEVLILPETYFYVTNIEEHGNSGYRTIYMELFNKDEEEAEIAQDRCKSFMGSILD